MEFTSIGLLALTAVLGILGYFIKVIHNDVRQNTKDVGENKGNIKSLSNRIEHESEMRNQSYNNIMQILSEIKEELKELRK